MTFPLPSMQLLNLYLASIGEASNSLPEDTALLLYSDFFRLDSLSRQILNAPYVDKAEISHLSLFSDKTELLLFFAVYSHHLLNAEKSQSSAYMCDLLSSKGQDEEDLDAFIRYTSDTNTSHHNECNDLYKEQTFSSLTVSILQNILNQYSVLSYKSRMDPYIMSVRIATVFYYTELIIPDTVLEEIHSSALVVANKVLKALSS